MKISECIAPENVEIDLNAPSKVRLLQILAKRASASVGIDEQEIFSALESREKLGSTGVGAGIAIPHASITGLKEPIGFVVRLGKPMDFDSIDGAPVDIVCLLLSPLGSNGSHLTVLSRIARLFRSPEVARDVRNATSQIELYSAMTGADA